MPETKKAPEIRFPGFDDDWKQRRARELCSISTGKSNTQDQTEDGIYPFYIRSDAPVKSNKYLYDCEAVITIGDGNIGKVFHYVNGKFDLHQRCYKMTDFKDVLGKYFYYFFSTKFYERAMKMTAKGTVDSVRLEMISEMDIRFPTLLQEQWQIADFFTHIDNLITLYQRELDGYLKLKITMLQKIFPRNGENVPKVRFQGFSGDWCGKKLGEHFTFKNGLNASKEAFNSGGTCCIGVADVYKCLPIIVADVAGTVKVSSKELDENIVKYGDILFQRSSETKEDIGHASVYIDNAPAVFNGFVIRAVPHNLDYDAFFMHYELQTESIRRQTIALGQGAQHYNIGQESLSEISVKIPEISEQRKIGAYFAKLDELIAVHQRELEGYKKLKRAMLQKMFV